MIRIAGQAEFTRQMPPEPASTATGLGRIAAASRDAIATLSDVGWSLDARQESVDTLLSRMREQLLHLAAPLGLTWVLTADGLPPDLRLSPTVRQCVYLVFQKSITNAVRHGRLAHLVVELARASGALTLTVGEEGAGPGPSFSWPVGGQGLRNMQQRAHKLGGTLTAAPGPSGAWKVVLTVPMGRGWYS